MSHDVETVEIVSDFIFGGSKITADGDCSHEIKRRLLLGSKVMTNLDNNVVRRRWRTEGYNVLSKSPIYLGSSDKKPRG